MSKPPAAAGATAGGTTVDETAASTFQILNRCGVHGSSPEAEQSSRVRRKRYSSPGRATGKLIAGEKMYNK